MFAQILYKEKPPSLILWLGGLFPRCGSLLDDLDGDRRSKLAHEAPAGVASFHGDEVGEIFVVELCSLAAHEPLEGDVLDDDDDTAAIHKIVDILCGLHGNHETHLACLC